MAPPFMGWGGERLSSFLLSGIFFNCQMGVDGTTLMGREELVLLHKRSRGWPGACKKGHDILALKELPGQRGRQSRQQLVSDHVLSAPTKACTGPWGHSERLDLRLIFS